MNRKFFLLASALPLCLPLGACESQSTLPAEYLGRWYFSGSSGGIAGTGTGAPTGGWIVITADNEIEHYGVDGALAATERFGLSRERSIYSGEEAWVLVEPGGFARVIELYENGTMLISDNVYDGFSSGYQRTPTRGG